MKMNSKTAKKVRKEIDRKERVLAEGILDSLNYLPFWKRVKIAVRIIRKKL